VPGLRRLSPAAGLKTEQTFKNSSVLYAVVGLRGGFNKCQNLRRIEPNGPCENDEFNHIDPALPAFDPCNKRLMAFEPLSQILLGKASPFARIGQRLDEYLLPFASDRFRHAPHTFRDVASGSNPVSKIWIF
jgi:hypothetical protein